MYVRMAVCYKYVMYGMVCMLSCVSMCVYVSYVGIDVGHLCMLCVYMMFACYLRVYVMCMYGMCVICDCMCCLCFRMYVFYVCMLCYVRI